VTTPADSAARMAAVDPSRSYCVTAPAGSGKTELLIQRYLCLLARVSRPEQVLAITFTRKAAAEMRERVIQALQAAQAGDTCCSEQQLATRAFAEQVLSADADNAWQLLRNNSRFNIRTIDGFCAGLTQQMPVLSQFGGQARVLEDAAGMYSEAVQELYKLIDDNHPIATDLAALMLHFDNDWERLQLLLVAMLACREQWRGYIGVHHAPAESEAHLLATVNALVQDELRDLAGVLAPYQAELLDLMQFSAANLRTEAPLHFPGDTAGELTQWYSLASLLLTGSGQWRKKISRTEGFPADKGRAQELKTRWKTVVAELQQIDGLHVRLAAVRSLPVVSADSQSWELVVHLSRLLPVLAAQLLLVFRKYGVVDHSQVAQSALSSLGEDTAPTELALRLDYQIEHILVDEFQDTSVTQYELMHKLTRGWGEHNSANPDSPRTLLIVGDGMQSIYGFRGANVGLFLQARLEGFNGVRLQHLELLCNFRSDAGIVNWVNNTFARAFPVQDDALRSQVRYSPAVALRPSSEEPAVALHAFTGDAARSAEIAFICDRIVDCLEEGSQTVAVLGRSRGHLQVIITELKRLNIAYNAPELDSLARSATVADLLTLCHALANDADRLAWMSVLRAPWCGLQLGDLLCIAGYSEAAEETSIWSRLENATLHNQLSVDGKHRLLHILPVLRHTRASRDRLSLRVWIEQAWVGLGGPGCAQHPDELLDAETFLQLLELAEAEGVGLDLEWLSARVQKSYLAGGDPDSKVQLLTLHKAKGLEFDRVILPQLDKVPRGNERELLLWEEHSSSVGERSFLLAADDRSPANSPTLYSYLRAQRSQKTLLESTRLLYVGATRAVHRLELTACVNRETHTGQFRAPSRPSLLYRIWPTFKEQARVHKGGPAPVQIQQQQLHSPSTLRRLSRGLPWEGSITRTLAPPARAATADAVWKNRTERCTGTVVHAALEELSRRPVLPEHITPADKQRWRCALQRLGIGGDALNAALQAVVNSVSCCLQSNSSGRWVLSPDHRDARSEWALTTVNAQGRIEDIVIDRSFIDSGTGVRWVIDYKNSVPAAHEGLEEFARRQGALYLDQLLRYRDAVWELDKSPLRCGLLFTALGYLHILPQLDLPAGEVRATL